MHREYHRWFSHRLNRDMELLVYGHAGAKVLVFPTRDGNFHEYEDLSIVYTLADKIDAVGIQRNRGYALYRWRDQFVDQR
jgi:esterase/lipase superfamily enzyme